MGINLNNLFAGCRNLMLFLGLPSVASMSSNTMEFSKPNLTLFHHHHSYYSRKVWLALEEKKLPYHTRLINIVSSEQYEPWFLKINPRGEIPVMMDDDKIIIDSKRIIEYLEENYSQGDYLPLVPLDGYAGLREKVAELRSQVDAMEGNRLAFGLLYHREYVRDSDEHYPYNLPGIKSSLMSQVSDMPSSLRKIAEKYPENKDILLQKAANAEKTRSIVQSKESFAIEVATLEALLLAMENQLSSHPKGAEDWWLCHKTFTQADVSLTILMDRLWRLGGAEYFWGRHPQLKRYFQRVQEREAYKKIEPSFWDDFAFLWPYAVGVLVILVIIVAGLALIPVIRNRMKS